MKRLLFLFLLPITVFSQDSPAKPCPDPGNDVRQLCDYLVLQTKARGTATDTVEYFYEQLLWEFACAKMGVDDLETAKKKIQVFWNRYKTKCTCNSVNFPVKDGSVLKYSINHKFLEFIDMLVTNYELDINFIDPADNKNLLDYFDEEVTKLKKAMVSEDGVKVFEGQREYLVKLGAKRSK